MTPEPRKFAYIDALRGLAIMAVILVHSQGAVAPASPWLQVLTAAGARGVQLFYVASFLNGFHPETITSVVPKTDRATRARSLRLDVFRLRSWYDQVFRP